MYLNVLQQDLLFCKTGTGLLCFWLECGTYCLHWDTG